MRELISQSAQEAVRAASFLTEEVSLQFMQKAAEEITACLQNGHKVLLAGNGGSLCDAMHFAEELTGQFLKKRPALAAIALSDPAHMSCVSNDMGFESIFSRGVEALGRKGDVFIALTTSGNSANLFSALQMAKEKQLYTIAFLGKTGGMMKSKADLEWLVPHFSFSDRIQEAHMAAIHIIIEAMEEMLFGLSTPSLYAVR